MHSGRYLNSDHRDSNLAIREGCASFKERQKVIFFVQRLIVVIVTFVIITFVLEFALNMRQFLRKIFSSSRKLT